MDLVGGPNLAVTGTVGWGASEPGGGTTVSGPAAIFGFCSSDSELH